MVVELLNNRFEFDIREEVGKGGQAKVYKGRDITTGLLVAIKRIPMDKQKRYRLLEREMRNVSKLDSPYIVKYLALDPIYKTEGKDKFAYVVMEYVPGGTLANYLRSHGRLTDATAALWMHQLTFGLFGAWEIKIIHRDIKPGNILLTKPSPDAHVKICDFGISKDTSDDPGKTKIGTSKYMAPEIYEDDTYTLQVDIYSLGLVYLDMLLGLRPEKEPMVKSRLEQLSSAADISLFAKTLIPKMVHRDPRMRLKPHDLMQLFRFSIIEHVRSNAVCKVYKVWDYMESTYALMKTYNQEYSECYRIEAAIVSEKNEPGVISFISSFENNCYYGNSLVLEYCEGDTLEAFINTHGPVDEAQAKQWLNSLLHSLRNLHSRNIVLRSLSPANILLSRPFLPADLTICDFELAAMHTPGRSLDIGVSLTVLDDNLNYRAPEVLEGLTVTEACDVWSLGCIFYFLLEGKPPFPLSDSQSVYHSEAVLTAQKQRVSTNYMSEKSIDLLKNMLKFKDSERFTVDRCLRHPFLSPNILQEALDLFATGKQREVLHALVTVIRTDLEAWRLNDAYITTLITSKIITGITLNPLFRNQENIHRVNSEVTDLLHTLEQSINFTEQGSYLVNKAVEETMSWSLRMREAEREDEECRSGT